MKSLKIALVSLICTLCGACGPAFAQASEADYRAFLESTIWPQASARGVSRTTFDRIMGGKRLNRDIPGLVEPGSARTPERIRQAEFSAPARYFNPSNVNALTATGRQLFQKHSALLTRLERQYGVPGQILIAIWGRESGFGRVTIPHDAFEVLGTKAYMSTRPDLFRGELVAALEMVEKGMATPAMMKSSWAGALGQPQFLPSSYLEHAVDGDGDGDRDIWTSEADTLASIAAYLDHFGWEAGRDWGFEVTVPDALSCAFEGPDQRKTVSTWEGLGIKRVNGNPFPAGEAGKRVSLLMPAGRNGPAFLVTPNFYVIKEYNESDLYALFVGHVGDRIRYGSGDFTGRWGNVDTLLRSDIAAMQRALEGLGYDVGGADGLPGFKTRRSIGDWQFVNDRKPTCFPDADLVRAIR